MFSSKLINLLLYLTQISIKRKLNSLQMLPIKPFERRGGRIGEKSVTLILRKNRPVQYTFEI
jgi:hypothetical protein